ncbi:MAG: cob(I)yrinic acid a,c-diamide adenosyltransferase [Patescibacteria group bacterium]|nr:cob(I)yrinic acid a,c-diamide adenosyltransferase [Patescibacteria group bacterium]
MAIYTRTGDIGTTSVGSFKRRSKADGLVKILGDLDELNSSLGLVLSYSKTTRTAKILKTVQNSIFNLGAKLTGHQKNFRKLEHPDVGFLEREIDKIERELKPLRNFILPGGSKGSAHLHLARSVCRRAERTVAENRKLVTEDNRILLPYLNRLADLLFVLARFENQRAGLKDRLWNKEFKTP